MYLIKGNIYIEGLDKIVCYYAPINTVNTFAVSNCIKKTISTVTQKHSTNNLRYKHMELISLLLPNKGPQTAAAFIDG
jgi:hypothetical protein